MSWLIPRGKKKILYIGYSQNGKDRYKTTRTSDMAEAERKQKLFDLGQSDPDTKVPEATAKLLTITTLRDLYKKDVDLDPKTHETNMYSWNHFVRLEGDLLIAEIATESVIHFRDALAKEGYAAASISIYLRDLSKLMEFAVDNGYISRNPCKKRKSKKWAVEIPEEDEETFHLITPEEESTLFVNATPRMRRAMDFDFETGLRLSQIVNLEWKQLDSSNTCRIPKQKRQKARAIPLTPRAVSALGPRKLQGSVFGIPSEDRLKKMWRGLMKRCGYVDSTGTPLFRFHDIRHTCASRLAQILKPHEVRDFFGWSSVALVDRYTHSKVEDIRTKLLAAAADRAALPDSVDVA